MVGISCVSAGQPPDVHDVYSPSTAKFLATYIVNLIVVLHGVFMNILPSDPPRALSTDVVFNALGLHASNLKTRSLNNIASVPGFSARPEKVIASIIKKRLGILLD